MDRIATRKAVAALQSALDKAAAEYWRNESYNGGGDFNAYLEACRKAITSPAPCAGNQEGK